MVDDFVLRGKAPVTFGRKSLMLSSRARKAAGSTIVAHLVSRITACQGGTVEFRVLDDRHVREAMVARPKPRDVYKNERLVCMLRYGRADHRLAEANIEKRPLDEHS
ncbi:hypothetical protein IVB55_00085 [Bradyrhizobium sp. CW4]|uniref:hypothetical protein n=1 Tax=Bradyrhizobium sp. CW4 TaxID=2782687 RepID=UPI001FF74615|nr:hypothetical protein [Bradyrhizobium sp. CW4]MCK1411517.1 hypothetical protein [Bradyrhizobium sp. CW4]